MEQALELDQVLLIHTSFASSRQDLNLNWTLLFIPDRASLHALAAALAELESHLTARWESCPLPVRPVHRDPSAIVSVAIGQWAVAAAPAKIRTLLGSCVGVILYDRVARLGGLAHIVLPDSRGAADHPGKFADTAIPAMIAEIERKFQVKANGRLVAKLVGGASMFHDRRQCEFGAEHRPDEPGGHRADPGRAADPDPGPRSGGSQRSALDPRHRFGHRRNQGPGRSGL